MQPTEPPAPPIASLLRSAWRITALYLQKSLRLYAGPAQWKGFPDSMLFAVIACVLTILLYAVQLPLSGEPLSVYWINLVIVAGAGAMPLWIRHDMPFVAASFGVMLVGLLPSLVLNGLQTLLTVQPHQWGAIRDVLRWLDTAWQTWMAVTGLRLSVAKVIEVERPRRDTE